MFINIEIYYQGPRFSFFIYLYKAWNEIFHLPTLQNSPYLKHSVVSFKIHNYLNWNIYYWLNVCLLLLFIVWNHIIYCISYIVVSILILCSISYVLGSCISCICPIKIFLILLFFLIIKKYFLVDDEKKSVLPTN
jgi:hypothetical protein